MRNRILPIILVIIMSITSVFPAYADEYRSENDTQSKINITNNKVLATTDDTIRLGDLREEFRASNAFNLTATGSDDKIATVEDFLREYTTSFYNQFIWNNNGAYIYPAVDSVFLSKEDWNTMISNLNAPISRDFAIQLIHFTEDCAEFLEKYLVIEDADTYIELIDSYYPEFTSLLKENAEAAQYWISVTPDGVYWPSEFSVILHEIQHEMSATKSGVFGGRMSSKKDNRKSVIWNRKPQDMYYYLPGTQEWVSVHTQGLPQSRSMLSKATPKAIKSSKLYSQYLGTSMISNVYGLYGMLQELASITIDARCTVVSSSIVAESILYEDQLKACYWWRGAVLNYLNQLQTEKYSMYKIATSDSSLMSVIYNLISYMDNQIAMVNLEPSADPLIIALRDWAYSDNAQAQLELAGKVAGMVRY